MDRTGLNHLLMQISRCNALMILALISVCLTGCATDGTPKYPGSMDDAVSELKAGGKPDRIRDVGLWLQDQLRSTGQVMKMESDDDLSLLQAECDWAVWDVRPEKAGSERPGQFADHDYLSTKLKDRPGVAIAVSFGHDTPVSRLRPEHFTHYYDLAKKKVEGIDSGHEVHVRTLFRLGKLTAFEQSTFYAVRFGDMAYVQFHMGLGTEHQIWVHEDGNWLFLHRLGAWVG